MHRGERVRKEETDCHKKGILRLLGKFIHCPVRSFVIQLVRILGRPNPPIHQLVILRGVHQFLRRKTIRQFRPGTRLVKFSFGQSSMIDLAQGRSGITVEFERLWDRNLIGIFRNLLERGLERINSGGRWPETKHNRGS